MTTLAAVCSTLAEIAPLALAESWDNVGLLVGDRQQSIERLMTCLTISPTVVDEAVDRHVDVIVTHHPLPFKPLQRITADTVTGTMLLALIQNETAIYSAHTAFDSATDGVNQMWADAFALQSIGPLIAPDEMTAPNSTIAPGGVERGDPCVLGAGRVGKLAQPMSLDALIRSAADKVGATTPRRVGRPDRVVQKVAFACGSGGSFLAAARRQGCDALITGEATFHTCLEAESCQIGLGLLGHYWSERFAMERLAEKLAAEHPAITVWASGNESDPLATV